MWPKAKSKEGLIIGLFWRKEVLLRGFKLEELKKEGGFPFGRELGRAINKANYWVAFGGTLWVGTILP